MCCLVSKSNSKINIWWYLASTTYSNLTQSTFTVWVAKSARPLKVPPQACYYQPGQASWRARSKVYVCWSVVRITQSSYHWDIYTRVTADRENWNWHERRRLNTNQEKLSIQTLTYDIPSSLQLPTNKWRSTGPGRSWCFLSITNLAALDGQYHSLSGTYFSASNRVTCLLPATQTESHAGSKVYIWNVFSSYLAVIPAGRAGAGPHSVPSSGCTWRAGPSPSAAGAAPGPSWPGPPGAARALQPYSARSSTSTACGSASP